MGFKGLVHFSGSAALHVNFDRSVSFWHSLLSLMQKFMLHEIFWLPFPALLNENDLKVNLKSGKNNTRANIFRNLFRNLQNEHT